MVDTELRERRAAMREQFLQDNEGNVRASIATAIANGAPLEEMVAILVHVADPFGAPFARSMGCNVEDLIDKTAPDRLPTYLMVDSRTAVTSHLGKYYPGLAQKLAQTHHGKIWVLVADVGEPQLFSLGMEKINLSGGGDA